MYQASELRGKGESILLLFQARELSGKGESIVAALSKLFS
jgi:polyphosphate kinase 2 (PPK2 family)